MTNTENNAPNQKLSIFTAKILKQSFINCLSYRVPHAFVFAEKINNSTLLNGHVIVSFDVISLFTNIPLNLVKNIVSVHWNSKIKQNSPLPLNCFLDALTLIFGITFCICNNTCYKQIKGCPMG